MEKKDIAEAIILNKKNEFLLQKKTVDYKTVAGGPWCLFGGEIEEGESPEQTIKRELKEEIGFSLENFRLFKTEDYELDNRFCGKVYAFVALFIGEISEIHLKEGAGFAFFDLSEISSIKITDGSLKMLKEYFGLKL